MCPGRDSRPHGEWWVAPSTNTDTPIPNFNKTGMDPDEEALNISRNILNCDELGFYQQAIVAFWRIFHYVVIHCEY
jgi:hypothetical protein